MLVPSVAIGFGEFILPSVVVNYATKIDGPGWCWLKSVVSGIGFNVTLELNPKLCM